MATIEELTEICDDFNDLKKSAGKFSNKVDDIISSDVNALEKICQLSEEIEDLEEVCERLSIRNITPSKLLGNLNNSTENIINTATNALREISNIDRGSLELDLSRDILVSGIESGFEVIKDRIKDQISGRKLRTTSTDPTTLLNETKKIDIGEVINQIESNLDKNKIKDVVNRSSEQFSKNVKDISQITDNINGNLRSSNLPDFSSSIECRQILSSTEFLRNNIVKEFFCSLRDLTSERVAEDLKDLLLDILIRDEDVKDAVKKDDKVKGVNSILDRIAGLSIDDLRELKKICGF